ncbi:endonuclease/exonuclease/phosphatase family protein [Agreia sp. COWG]|uniref:endonuclease/exonuclease/phosphatase family protein n=1 Tax=Agreia sp. COWG TaxID=2773266 RepID=UPI001925C590|nr:endonuclease/exonuclease/phosphatase family protein [Agreia sp. COWG]CAD5991142.1 Hydrolase [Agreia sp. COWG]
MSDAPLIGPAEAPDLHVMTYNIRRRMRHLNVNSPDVWARRKFLLRQLLERESPTLLGTQEALPDQAGFVSSVLGPHFRRIGHGREAGGTGEGCPLYFDTRRLRLESWQQLALSATPDVAGSRSWGNRAARIVVCARFTDLATRSPLQVFNTHLDHLSRRSRLLSAQMLLTLAKAGDEPTVVMGDMNTDVQSRPYEALTTTLQDAWVTTARRLTPEFQTFSNYRAPSTVGRRIDWLLVSRDVEVREAAINGTRVNGAAASDHEAVQVLLRFGKGVNAEA